MRRPSSGGPLLARVQAPALRQGFDTKPSLATILAALLFYVALSIAPFHASDSRGEVVPDLHATAVAVADNGESERRRAIREGLARVAVKLTGDRDAPRDPRFAAIADRAETLLDRFAYDEPAQAGGPRLLRLFFKPAETDTALAAAGFALWPAERPRLLLLVTINAGEAAGSHALARTGETGAQVRIRLLDAARARGLPVVLPEVDATDQRIFSSFAARRDPMLPVRMLKARYGADAVAVLLLEVTPASGKWDSHWDLGVGVANGSGGLSAVSLDEALAELMEGTVRGLVNRPR